MDQHPTSPAKKTFCVYADYVTRRYQEVEAGSPQEAYETAISQPECWQNCEEVEDQDDYRVSRDVEDTQTGEFVRVGEGDCGGCEDERYRACSASPTHARPGEAAQDDTPPPEGAWTEERWAAARGDSRWAAERWAADMRDRMRRYPTLHAEDKIRLATRVLWDVSDTWDHDALAEYPADLPSFDEYLAEIASRLHAIRWDRPNPPPTPHGDAA